MGGGRAQHPPLSMSSLEISELDLSSSGSDTPPPLLPPSTTAALASSRGNNLGTAGANPPSTSSPAPRAQCSVGDELSSRQVARSGIRQQCATCQRTDAVHLTTHVAIRFQVISNDVFDSDNLPVDTPSSTHLDKRRSRRFSLGRSIMSVASLLSSKIGVPFDERQISVEVTDDGRNGMFTVTAAGTAALAAVKLAASPLSTTRHSSAVNSVDEDGTLSSCAPSPRGVDAFTPPVIFSTPLSELVSVEREAVFEKDMIMFSLHSMTRRATHVPPDASVRSTRHGSLSGGAASLTSSAATPYRDDLRRVHTATFDLGAPDSQPDSPLPAVPRPLPEFEASHNIYANDCGSNGGGGDSGSLSKEKKASAPLAPQAVGTYGEIGLTLIFKDVKNVFTTSREKYVKVELRFLSQDERDRWLHVMEAAYEKVLLHSIETDVGDSFCNLSSSPDSPLSVRMATLRLGDETLQARSFRLIQEKPPQAVIDSYVDFFLSGAGREEIDMQRVPQAIDRNDVPCGSVLRVELGDGKSENRRFAYKRYNRVGESGQPHTEEYLAIYPTTVAQHIRMVPKLKIPISQLRVIVEEEDWGNALFLEQTAPRGSATVYPMLCASQRQLQSLRKANSGLSKTSSSSDDFMITETIELQTNSFPNRLKWLKWFEAVLRRPTVYLSRIRRARDVDESRGIRFTTSMYPMSMDPDGGAPKDGADE